MKKKSSLQPVLFHLGLSGGEQSTSPAEQCNRRDPGGPRTRGLVLPSTPSGRRTGPRRSIDVSCRLAHLLTPDGVPHR
jgi:hypothetical protein